MKKFLVFSFLLLTNLIYSQAASKVNNGQNVYSTGQPRVVLSCDTLPSGQFRLYPKASVTWNWNQILSTPTTLSGYSISDGVPNTRTINGYNLSTDVTLGKADIGLGNVDNTSDLNKPISTATQTALDGKQSTLVSGTTIKTVETQNLLGSGNIDLNKTDVGLSNVDNTSDLNKPVSTATQTALDTKQATLVSGTNIKTIEGQSLVGSGNVDLTKSDVGLSNVDNTSDATKNVLSATKLTTARTINGVSFDGTSNITVADNTKEPIITAGTTSQYWRGDKTWQTLTSGTVTSVGITSSDFSISGSPVTTSGNITANLNTSGVIAGTYSGVTVNNKGIVTAATNRVFNNNVSRTLNTNYTISSTRDVSATYTVRIAYNITVLIGSTGIVNLQYSINGGSSWTTVSTISNSINLGLALTGYNDFVISGNIPANSLVRLDTTGSANATITYQRGSETYY